MTPSAMHPIAALALAATGGAGRIQQATTSILAVLIVGAAVYDLAARGVTPPPELIVMASAVIATYFVGYLGQSSTASVTASVDALHATVAALPVAIAAATATPAPAADPAATPPQATPGADPYGAV